jgi:diadenylate cyclase
MLPNPFSILPGLPKLTIASVIDIIVVSILVYQFLMMIRGRRAAPILAGLGILGVVYAIAVYAQLELLRTILAAVAPYTAIALIVMFQSELRRLLARIGRTQFVAAGSRLQRREMTQEILLAISKMATDKTGALIVVERDVGLRTFVESGVPLDAWISRDLLLSIFERGGALHDGAVIIQRDRVAAAACFLPLTMNPMLLKELGTRHRAAIGITEEADCISIIVSEESGKISVAAFGEVEVDVTTKRVEERLSSHARRRDPRHTLLESPESVIRDLPGDGPVREAKGL